MPTDTALRPEALDQVLAPHFAALRAFVDRRIAELSAEVAAAVQLAGLTEENLAARIAEVHAEIARLIAVPASGARHSGLELEAVVQATEAAAEVILEAAEAIQSWLDEGARDTAAAAALSARVNAIFQACSFQDLTGQRIRRAIRRLQQVETMLEGLAPGVAAARPPRRGMREAAPAAAPEDAGPDLAQAEIDRLLDG